MSARLVKDFAFHSCLAATALVTPFSRVPARSGQEGLGSRRGNMPTRNCDGMAGVR